MLRRALTDWRTTMIFESQRSPSYARALIGAVDRALRILQENPQIGSAIEHEPRLLQWYVRDAKLWVYYVPSPDEIAIHRIKPARTKSLKPGIDF